MNKKLEQLTKIIQEAVPEILELKFGCNLEAKDYTMKYVGFNNNQHAIFVVKNSSMLFVDKLGKVTKILGRDITLTDVLRAMQKIVQSDRTYMVSPFGIICDTFFTQYATWDLSLPLHLQSQETVDFLLSILT